MSDMPLTHSSARATLSEFWTPSTVAALNETLRSLDLDANAIVAVFYVQADPMVTPEPSRFRVLVRAPGEPAQDLASH